MESGLKLLPCPFCGGKSEIIIDTDDDGRFAAVTCPKCGAGSRQHYFCGDDARDYAASAWNTRAPSDAALVEALEERVELLQSALLEIAEKDWHARTPPKPRADGGMRGWAGHLAVWALTGLHGSYSGDDAVRAALAAAKGQQP